MMLRTVRLEELTWPEIRDGIASGIASIIVPVGSTEQHGPHLPLGTDSYHTVAMLEQVPESASVHGAAPAGRQGGSSYGISGHDLNPAGNAYVDHSRLLPKFRAARLQERSSLLGSRRERASAGRGNRGAAT